MNAILLRITPLLLIAILVTGCAPRHSVYPAHSPEGHEAAGVTYFLPRTVLEIEFTVTKTILKPGPLKAYAPRVGIPIPPELDSEGTEATPPVFEMGDPVIRTSAEPDPDNAYKIAIRGGPLQERSLAVQLSEAGFLIDGESKAQDRTLAFAVSTFEAVASVIGAAAKFGPMLTKPDEITDPKHRLAIDTVEGLKGIQVSRLTLLSNPREKESLTEALSHLDAMERSLLSRFYTREITSATVTYSIVPQRAVPSSAPPGPAAAPIAMHELFSFSPTKGVLPIYPAVRWPKSIIMPAGSETTTDKRNVELVVTDNTDIRVKSLTHANEGGRGYHYRIPGTATIEVVIGPSDKPDRVMARSNKQVAQFGTVVSLPEYINSVGTELSVALYESSGALKKAGSKSAALDDQLVKRVGDATAQAISAYGDARKAAAEKEQKSRLAKIAEEMKNLQSIRESATALGMKPVPAASISSTE